MKVVWTRTALAERDAILTFIFQDNPAVAFEMDDRFGDAAATLESLPDRGRPGAIQGTRELSPHPNYRLIYEVSQGRVVILSILHAARQWPPATP